MKNLSITLMLATLLFSANAMSTTISWVDWESITGNGATGEAVIGTQTISVNQTNTGQDQINGGTSFWTGNAFTFDGVNNAPTTDLIRLKTGGQVTLNFNSSVSDVYIALVSWNGGSSEATFSGPIEVASNGVGYYGSGIPTVTPAGNGFTSSGEVHGILKLVGDYTSFSFTHGSEDWHGFTIGFAQQQTTPQVSAPSTVAIIMISIIAILLRKKRNV